jgi:hypothetical protein
MRYHLLAFVGLCAVALFGSFSLTLWLTAPQQLISDKTGGNESVQPTTTVISDKTGGNESVQPTTAPYPGSTRRLYVEKLAHREVSSDAALFGAAQALGFVSSSRMRGYVDGIKRINDREVTANGWLLDAEGESTPLDLIVFVKGGGSAITRTGDSRPGVATTLGLSPSVGENVGYHVTFNCQPGEQAVVVGVNAYKEYVPLVAPKCP